MPEENKLALTLEEMAEQMRVAVKAAEAQLPAGVGVALLVFDMQGPIGSRANYISNCQRDDMIAAMKEMIARWEGQPLQSGQA
jgi:hypothetical protein